MKIDRFSKEKNHSNSRKILIIFVLFYNNREQCSTCKKTVYAAEKTLGPKNKIYHKLCLRCLSCNKSLQAGTFVDHDNEPFCKGCYAKYFGPRGVGFGALSYA